MSDALAAAVFAGQEDAVALLSALVTQPTENPPGDTAAATEWLALWLEERGHMVERHPVPAPFARHYRRTDVTNLIVRRTFGPGPTIALHAPLDTLPAGEGWHREPFGAEIREGYLHGRGARDSKADVAAYIAVLEALAAAGASAGTLELHVTSDEEGGGFLGPQFLLGQSLTEPDAVIAAGTAYQVVTGQQGVLHLEVLLRGQQAHASRPQDGRDAIRAAVPLMAALHAHADTLAEPLTLSTIGGGRGVNIVADMVSFTIDRRLAQDEDGETVEADLAALITASVTAPGVEVECRRLLLAEPVNTSEPSERLASTLSRHAQAAFDHEIPVVSAPVVSGARHYALAGIALALYGVGPPIVGEGVDFTGDESVSLHDMKRATLALATAVDELLRGPE
ncbi:M20/M25/M40 family metallo-hydrolase [Acuticoccus sp. MNP-M23]|uniref:M20/M25/M40 family metallo-hydrolase n=1 Tax=Acuticoccus sp. MNP-M23 TaxID=3072793 RepID=UPI00281641D3|nr:M20/M25/M40 family metallo-hydrolase [Acuticoccus sp. MNP-M23]WMS42173.1 M20/M25/M40 family metallo-hydrolase [Acuticoccus sp. MNP-M23]